MNKNENDINSIILKKLPVGEQSIKEVLSNNYIYVDKTEYIYKIITENKYYFLSRPRRFGKSLLISTLKEIFSGNKELFKECWIYKNTDYDWKSYPVIHLDFSNKKADIKKNFYTILIEQLKDIGFNYDINIKEKDHVTSICDELIKALYKNIGPVVILIDEYDKPILDNIIDLELANINRNILRNLFESIKANSEYIKFVFITGITKFAKTSMFSGMNNLRDISVEKKYNSLLGYTQQELEFYFEEYINLALQDKDVNILEKRELLDKIKHWYNGYSFIEINSNNETVYNPFSILNFFSSNRFSNYWSDSGNPSFLIDLIKHNEYSMIEAEKYPISVSDLNTFDIENIDFSTLLFQAGYLTIESYSEKTRSVVLKYPNYEVEESLTEKISKIIDINLSKKIISLVPNFTKHLNNNDIDGFIKEIQKLILELNYFNSIKKESYYVSMVIIMIKMIGIKAFSESATNYGRIDLMFEHLNNIYIFEFKLNGSAQEALNQIKEKDYYKTYLNPDKTLYLIGININFKKKQLKNINEWIVEKI